MPSFTRSTRRLSNITSSWTCGNRSRKSLITPGNISWASPTGQDTRKRPRGSLDMLATASSAISASSSIAWQCLR